MDIFSDELPVQLTLPRAFREAQNRQQLSSLALLGQEFWRYPMANPRLSSTTPTTANTSPTPASAKTESGIGTTIFSSIHQQKIITSQTIVAGQIFSPSTPSMVGIQSLAGTPSDTASSLSSFTSTGQHLMSPESADTGILMSPLDASQTGIIGKTSTFKTQNRKSLDIEKLINNSLLNGNSNGENGNIRSVRPTPPSTLNLGSLRIPPAPPKRWTKSNASNSPNETTDTQMNNFTVTTTVTFSVDKNNPNSQQTSPNVTSPNNNSTVIFLFSFPRKISSKRLLFFLQFQTISKRLSPEGECKISGDTLSSQGSKRWQSQSSKESSHSRKIMSPMSNDAPSVRSKRSRARKESKHYQVAKID